MSKNTKTYVLIAAVLGIWGTIGYQVVSGLRTNEPETAQSDIDISFAPKTYQEASVFSVSEVDRDPFLGTLSSKRSDVKPRKVVKKTIKDTLWMPITYNGMVKRQNSLQQIFVVNISGTQYLLKKGQTINDVTLVSGTVKEIVVKYKNKQKTIIIQ